MGGELGLDPGLAKADDRIPLSGGIDVNVTLDNVLLRGLIVAALVTSVVELAEVVLGGVRGFPKLLAIPLRAVGEARCCSEEMICLEALDFALSRASDALRLREPAVSPRVSTCKEPTMLRVDPVDTFLLSTVRSRDAEDDDKLLEEAVSLL